ncbi:MAG: hypothetical protein AUK63_796 [bacterium P3]|nr:MAG: hypothetical protein AUK63_796 [bacterium P3]KWW41864.1 MAG: hypothetical protein F083_792 [bacterium F083]
MSLIDDYILERTCTYKGETYKVRDNGAVYRQPRPEGRLRKDDGKWTFGEKNTTNGYMYIGQHRVHIIVATAFYGENDSKVYVVDHIDTNRCNNRAENLRWLTRLENALLNEDTCRKITYLCGGDIMKFINNPSCLHDLAQDPDISWMRTVTAEEAKTAYARVQSMRIQQPRNIHSELHIENEDLKRKEQAEAMEWYRTQNNWRFTAPKQPIYSTPDPVFTKAAYPETALQKDWKTPTEFICCPIESTETPLQDYYNNLTIGKLFSRNKYTEHTVFDFALMDNDKILIIATKDSNPNAIKHFGLLKVYHSGIQFIHESISTYFEENGVRKYFNIEQGLDWNGPNSIDDYC